eukprot:TRINITY_DN4231_c1_g3_i1.p1 TRINITY_DN4231_c1_g3~~TRINITY_DN4231_c1_g3_i1.p1  ORF type:complete len:569 (-),score=92.55 TRINITY_DN4231_c1_g3_i1:270-1976(-)
MWSCFLVAPILLTCVEGQASHANVFGEISAASQAQVDKLEATIEAHHLAKHDYLKCFEGGHFANMLGAASIFAHNVFPFSRNFNRYLDIVANKMKDSMNEVLRKPTKMAHGSYEEQDLVKLESNGVHREWIQKKGQVALFANFLSHNGVIVKDEVMNAPPTAELPGGRFAMWVMSELEGANACEALAILGFAIEGTVSTLSSFVLRGLKTTSMDPQVFAFYSIRSLIDNEKADLLKQAFAWYHQNHDSEMCVNAAARVQSVLDRHSQLLDELRDQTEADSGATCALPRSPSKVTQAGAIAKARKLTSKMPKPAWSNNLMQKMALSARILADQGHGNTLSGQISCREGNSTDKSDFRMWTLNYGKSMDFLLPSDFILVDWNLDVIEGAENSFPNMATRFHSHVYASRSDMRCMIHTHPPHVSALAQTGEPLRIAHMDTMALYEDVAHLKAWPGVPFGDEEGEIISGAIGSEGWSALLAHHGLFVGGQTIEEATYRAWFLEYAAQLQLLAGGKAKGPEVNELNARRAGKWRISPGPVEAHFNNWANLALRNPLHADMYAEIYGRARHKEL